MKRQNTNISVVDNAGVRVKAKIIVGDSSYTAYIQLNARTQDNPRIKYAVGNTVGYMYDSIHDPDLEGLPARVSALENAESSGDSSSVDLSAYAKLNDNSLTINANRYTLSTLNLGMMDFRGISVGDFSRGFTILTGGTTDVKIAFGNATSTGRIYNSHLDPDLAGLSDRVTALENSTTTTSVVSLTQTEYDNLATPLNNTLYIIVEEDETQE